MAGPVFPTGAWVGVSYWTAATRVPGVVRGVVVVVGGAVKEAADENDDGDEEGRSEIVMGGCRAVPGRTKVDGFVIVGRAAEWRQEPFTHFSPA